VKEPRRAALGLLHELGTAQTDVLLHLHHQLAGRFRPAERAALEMALMRSLNSPGCSSVGRLFDAVAALTGLRQESRFEGQAAMELEFVLDGIETDEHYDLHLVTGYAPTLDWSPMILGIGRDLVCGVALGEISAKFHNALAEAIVRVAQHVDCPRVALSGGCFQNRYLTERVVRRLREEGFQPYWHQRVPPNDGGIALGQVVAARRELAARSTAVCDSTSRNTSDSSATAEPLAPCGWSDGPSRAPLQTITHHASR
jgi:hydrogenase maturation protein HypF